MHVIVKSPHKDQNCHCAGNLGGELFFADLSLQPPEDGAHLIMFGFIW